MLRLIFLVFLLACPNAWAVNYCSDVNTSGAWKFEETSGSYADCTANANTGVISGTINQSATGKFNYGAGFTAVNNTKIDFGSATTLDNVFDGGGTFAIWAGFTTAGTASVRCTGSQIAGKDGSNDGWGLCINSDGGIKFSYKWAGGWVDWTSSTTPVPFNDVKHHILVYYNSDSSSNDPTVYFDCAALTMVEGGTAPFSSRNTDAAQNMLLGLDASDTGETNGIFDEVILYNGDLTGACTVLSTNGIDGTQGAAAGGIGKIFNGVTLNAITF